MLTHIITATDIINFKVNYMLLLASHSYLNNSSKWLQSHIARNMLENQLRRLGIFGAEETISSHPNLDESYKICECLIKFQIIFFYIYIYICNLPCSYLHLLPSSLHGFIERESLDFISNWFSLISVGWPWGWYKYSIFRHSCSKRRLYQVFFP